MMHPKFFPISFVFVAIVTLFHLPASLAQGNELYQNCSQLFECGGIQGIGYPFWGANRPQACGHPSFSLNCTGDAPVLTIETRPYRVLAINNTTYTLKVVREAFWDNSCPQYLYNATLDETYFSYASGTGDLLLSYGCTSSLTGIIGQFTCLANGTSGTFGIYSSPSAATLANIPTGVTCTTSVIMRVDSTEAQALASSGANVTQVLNSGVGLLWQANNSNCEQCVKSGGQCGTNSSNSGSFICYCSDRDYAYACGSSSSSGGRRNLVLILGTVISTLGVLILFCIVVKKCTPSDSIFFGETKTENHRNIEAFLKNCVSLSPKRYTYSDIKKITNSFRIKLGQGGFGFVFKGELENGCLVAVKVLKGLKGNGDEFINEVATISRTSHVHIVTLLGFCFEGSHRALIYEYMCNGSLDKFIHDGGSLTYRQLGWDALYQIAIGIARGLEYLHRGCNTRILHFDIKPHNILLSEDFCPKISDFGLAKLCPQKESIISLLGARGTPGYIAPEVFSRNFGGVSHKSDVYSYGMMVLEMVGGRKNISVEVDHTSEIYFPHWVYKRLELDEELGLHKKMGESLVLRGTMRAHTDWVTAIATPIDNSDMIVTASRDKSIILWHLTKEDKIYGLPHRRLTGHSHFVQDVVLSSDGQFALSGSWDGELRLWDLATGTTARRFVGHTKDVLSVAFSLDNRQIVSASRDRSIKLWNTLGECKYTIQDVDAHSDWVSCVRFSPNTHQPTIVSSSWDRTVKIWNLTNCKLRSTLAGHSGYVNTVAVSPDGSLCASGGKDGVILLWDLAEGKRLYSLDAGSIVHALCFSPNRYWLCAATEASIKIWDLESKTVVVDLRVDAKQEAEMNEGGAAQSSGVKNKVIYCTSLSWSADGSTLFSGYTDGIIRVWGIGR